MRSKKTHHYTQDSREHTFVLEPIVEGTKSYATGQGLGIECGDHIIWQSGLDTTRYRVEAIGYSTTHAH